MILHIGQSNVVFIRSIIAIIDKQSMLSGSTNRNFLMQAEEEKRLISADEDNISSYVITNENGRCLIYCSSISCGTLMRRFQSSSSLKTLCKAYSVNSTE